MLPLVLLALALPDITPRTSEAVSHAAAIAAGEDARLDVVSELDLQDAIDHDAQRQLCGGSSESCATQLADAYDARLVLFLRLYLVGDVAHVALTLRDVKANRVLHRADIFGDEQALFTATQTATREIVSHFTEHPAEGRTRLFIGRAAIDASALTTTTTPEPAPGPSPLVLGGGVAAAAGVVVGVVGAVVGLGANGVIGDPDTTTEDKDGAEPLRVIGYGGVGVGVATVVAGGALVALGLGGGE